MALFGDITRHENGSTTMTMKKKVKCNYNINSVTDEEKDY